MAGSLQPRIKTWSSTEDVDASDLNAEFDNVLLAMQPLLTDDYSVNVAQMQVVTDPGEVGTESLATTLAGELARLRNMIKEITGEAQWYASPPTSLSGIVDAVGGALADNRIISGRARADSSQAIYLVPHGTNRTVRVDGTPTNFVYAIDGVQYTISSDVVSATLLAAPGSNNTALVNDAALTGGVDSKFMGEYGSELTIDNAGTEIVALVGKLAGFKIGAEYFIARVKSITKLTEIRRGYFFDSADATLPRVVCSDNDTVTLMKLAWIFAKTNLTIVATYNEPFVSGDEPSGPATGDYWFDIQNDIWKTFDGATWSSAGAILIGTALSNTTGTIAARSLDFFKGVESTNTVRLEKFDATQVRGSDGDQVSVYGTTLNYGSDLPMWDMDTDLDTGLVEAASTLYYFYLTENGDSVISDLAPMDRRADLKGMYHPFHTWRCVGQAFNNASSDLEAVISYNDEREDNYALSHAVAANALTVIAHAPPQNLIKFKSVTAVDPEWELAAILPGTSLTVSSGSTLGTTSATNENLFAHLIMFSGRAELAIAQDPVGNGRLVTTVAEGGAGAADSIVLYSTAVRTSVPVRLFSKVLNNQTTAGTWAAALSLVNLWPFALGDGNFKLKTFTGSGTWTKSAGLQKAIVVSTGGGAGGGNASGANSGAGGGGAGGTCVEVFNTADLGATETVTIGAAGAATSNGGNTTFGSLHTASGGVAGANSTGDAGGAINGGGSGGAAANGTINLGGGAGASGSASASNAAGGCGGNSFWGGGGRGASSDAAAAAGLAYGAGGGGGSVGAASNPTAGAGFAGVCVVIEFYA